MRALRISLILLVVFGVLFTVADRLSLMFAEGEVATRARSGLGLESEPGVSIKGFPFLTQLLGKRIDHVELDISDYGVELDGRQTRLEDLSIELRNTRIAGDFSGARAERASGTGVLGYRELGELATQEVKEVHDSLAVEFGYAGEGQVIIQVTVLGQKLVPEMTADLVLHEESQLVQLKVDEIPSLDGLPLVGSGLEDQLREWVDREREIRGLPEGLSLDGVEAAENGVNLAVTGTDVGLDGA
ncbi:LmeA family phospholipid-binding protein [Streptomyces aidingensis]|uniref:DUF2993 domain-containing protein n=1 Tax=Streptomyces aidingensis TaxID=910347 RepID=A0A1I1HPV1_9ACTN|nr:DUF2993 domain-containing protein [Streptomyces aidingensis]SFC25964.1 Protein of unknown function [Streptomyces aidingensis]